MRRLLCKECAADKKTGEREAYPGEFERVVFGIAGQPKTEQRTIYVNGEPQPVMDLGFYNCDYCNAIIRPGDLCCAWSVWTNHRIEPAGWEQRYFQPGGPAQ